MVTKCEIESTGMMAVNLPASAVHSHLASFEDLTVSCLNSTTDCVLSGPLPTLRKFKEYLDANAVCKNVVLSVPFGYHSSAMNPLLDELTQIAGLVTLQAPTIPIISNVCGETVRPGDASVFDAEYFAKHCAQPVQFERGVDSFLNENKVDAWIEIGPHTACLPMIKSIVKDGSSMLLPSLKKQQDPWVTLTSSLVLLYQSNVGVNWRNIYSHISAVSCVSLPSYPFSPSKFWVAFKEESGSEAIRVEKPRGTLSEYAMLHEWVQPPTTANGFTSIFETPIGQLAKSISGHQVAGLPLCPASVYLEQVLAGIAISWAPSGDRHAVLRGITFANALVYDQAVPRIVITSITLNNDVGTFNVSSRVDGTADPESVHARGEFKLQSSASTNTKFSRSLPAIKRNVSSITRPGLQHETFTTRTIYENLFPRVVDYSKEYHTMESLTIDASHMEGAANVRLPADYDKGKHVVHPVFLDTLLHVAGFVANLQGGRNDAFICTEVGSVKVLPELVDPDAKYTVYCNNVWIADEGIMSTEAWACKEGPTPEIVAYMKGMQFRRLRLDSFSRMLARAAGKSTIPSQPTSAPVRHVAFAKPSAPKPVASKTSSVDTIVLTIVAETCGIDASSVEMDTDLEALGVDSLMSIEIFGRLQSSFPGARLAANVLSMCTTTADIAREVASMTLSVPSSPSTSGMSTPGTLVSDDDEPTSLSIDGDDDVDIKGVLANVLAISVADIKDTTDFEHLGLDSLTSIEALHALKTERGLDLPGNFFEMYSTVQAVRGYFGSSSKKAVAFKSGSTDLSSLLRLDAFPSPIQTPTSTTNDLPLFLFHDGSGLVNYYSRVAPLHRPVWGLHNPHFITSEPWSGVAEMAKVYAENVARTAKGPVLLGGKSSFSTELISNSYPSAGWSFGGVAAYETALQLAKRGITVKGVVLIDAPNPENHVPLSTALIAAAAQLNKADNSEVGQLVKTQFAMNSAMLKDYDPFKTGGACPPLVFLRSTDGFNPAGVRDVPAWLADRSRRVSGWEKIAGKDVKILDIPGNHFQAFHPSNVSTISSSVSQPVI